MKLRVIAVPVICLVLLATACSSDNKSGTSTTSGETPMGKTIKISAANNGETITVAKGDKIEATVESSAGIPFTWKIADVNAEVLQAVLGTGAPIPFVSDDKVGGPLKFAFVFDVIATGDSPLELALVSITDPKEVGKSLLVSVVSK